jgi:hypothetical protein
MGASCQANLRLLSEEDLGLVATGSLRRDLWWKKHLDGQKLERRKGTFREGRWPRHQQHTHTEKTTEEYQVLPLGLEQHPRPAPASFLQNMKDKVGQRLREGSSLTPIS